MLTAEELRQIRRISLQASKRVDSLFGGGYRSAFKGRGMEFEEVRLYVPGDDVRHIDWNVTARTQLPHIKEFREERELTLMLAVDVSGSMHFGTGGRDGMTHKRLQMARIAGGLAYAAHRTGDRVGMLAFSDHTERYVKPRKTRGHVWRVIREVFEHEAEHPGTDLGQAIDKLRSMLKRRAVVCVISDFLDDGPWRGPLTTLASRHTVHALVLHDPAEQAPAPVGLIEVRDPETGRRRLIDTRAIRPPMRVDERVALVRGCGVRVSAISTDEDAYQKLQRHFARAR